MTYHEADFPFEEIRREDGNLFDSAKEAMAAGYAENQVWSIAGGDDNCQTYGPAHHYINVLGYIATNETHDGETYYNESWELDEEEE